LAPVDLRTDARRALLTGLIDHAPLFPPASLPLDEALAEDRRIRVGESGWLVRRFVVPRSKLQELPAGQLPLSVVLDTDEPVPDDPCIEAVETPFDRHPSEPAEHPREVYVELPPGDARLAELAALGLRAKVRCGGASAPTTEALAGFVRRCRDLALPFKATAGLHHAVRRGDQHGFLNLLAAAVFGHEEEALATEDAAAFSLTADAFAWRNRTAGPEEVAEIRRDLFVAFGSCSAQEPIDDLRALGALPA
jgi:hypothetical protein